MAQIVTKSHRINLFGGPGSGKSTIAHRLTGYLKSKGLNVEFVLEAAKKHAYKKEPIQNWMNLHLTNEQIESEGVYLDNGVGTVICECPVALCYFYGMYGNFVGHPSLRNLNFWWDEKYPAVNIFIERNESHYIELGRYQDLKQAKELDAFIKDQLANTYGYNWVTFSVHDYKGIRDFVRGCI